MVSVRASWFHGREFGTDRVSKKVLIFHDLLFFACHCQGDIFGMVSVHRRGDEALQSFFVTIKIQSVIPVFARLVLYMSVDIQTFMISTGAPMMMSPDQHGGPTALQFSLSLVWWSTMPWLKAFKNKLSLLSLERISTIFKGPIDSMPSSEKAVEPMKNLLPKLIQGFIINAL